MFFATINRKTVFLFLVLLTISLVSLGVRIPYSIGISSSSAKPKPRPRAIIENQIKTCKQAIKDIFTPVAVLERVPALVIVAFFIMHHAQVRSVSPSIFTVPRNSRAPPMPA
ncbi:MAG TPA: hypothetical protein VFF53_00990 [Geobacteraceae bacterium]|nr:hypothetical protein [Geobacteraceae bacterium]